jgi:hypothetical protein
MGAARAVDATCSSLSADRLRLEDRAACGVPADRRGDCCGDGAGTVLACAALSGILDTRVRRYTSTARLNRVTTETRLKCPWVSTKARRVTQGVAEIREST